LGALSFDRSKRIRAHCSVQKFQNGVSFVRWERVELHTHSSLAVPANGAGKLEWTARMRHAHDHRRTEWCLIVAFDEQSAGSEIGDHSTEYEILPEHERADFGGQPSESSAIANARALAGT
jgi:hypothetical protein